jgi:hypothetical protein
MIITSMAIVNYKTWSFRFAEIVERFIAANSVTANAKELNSVFSDALSALLSYKKETEFIEKIPLKESIKRAYELAVENQIDPWSVVLRTIAERAEDWADHISEENEVTQDIKDWLNSEALRDQIR